MAERLDPKEMSSIEEIAVSNAWEIAALLKVLEQKGLLSAQEVFDTITELRKLAPKTHGTPPSQEPLPEPYLLPETETAIIDRIFEVFNATGLTAHQARNCLVRVWHLIEAGERLANATRLAH